MDDLVRVIWLQNHKSKIFSKGIDLKSNALLTFPLLFWIAIYFHLKHQKLEEVAQYLRSVYDLAILFARYNKPLVSCLDGELSNGSAALFTSIPFAFSTKSTTWKLNETSLGYFPDCGSSYHLSRLQGELGVYLALTGHELNWRELSYYGLTKGTFKNNVVTSYNSLVKSSSSHEGSPVFFFLL